MSKLDFARILIARMQVLDAGREELVRTLLAGSPLSERLQSHCVAELLFGTSDGDVE